MSGHRAYAVKKTCDFAYTAYIRTPPPTPRGGSVRRRKVRCVFCWNTIQMHCFWYKHYLLCEPLLMTITERKCENVTRICVFLKSPERGGAEIPSPWRLTECIQSESLGFTYAPRSKRSDKKIRGGAQRRVKKEKPTQKQPPKRIKREKPTQKPPAKRRRKKSC